MSSEKPYGILMVDDEPNVLSGYRRTVGRTHKLTIAEGGGAALKVMASGGPFAVVVTDMRMPGMNGLEFIEAARAVSKETVFMMLTGNGDQQTAIDAINRGNIFRFLTKPCAPEQLDAALLAGIRQYELVTAERVLLRETFTGSINLLVDALDLANPALASIQSTIKQVHQDLCAALDIKRDWQMKVASCLCLIGLVTVPGLKPDEAISEESLELAASLGHRLINNLPRLSLVAGMILHQREPGKLPSDLKSLTPHTAETVGAQLLRFCVDIACKRRRLGSLADALAEMKAADVYDHRLIRAVRVDPDDVGAGGTIIKEIPVAQLESGMEIDADILRADGMLILSAGQHLTELSVAALRNYIRNGSIQKTVKIRAALQATSKAA